MATRITDTDVRKAIAWMPPRPTDFARPRAAPLRVRAKKRTRHEGLEAPLVERILDALHAIGLLAWRNAVEPSRFGDWTTGLGVGSPDIIGADPAQGGRMIAIEVKRAERKSVTSPKRRVQQAKWRLRALAGNILAAQVASVEQAIGVVLEARRGWVRRAS
jgi:hypothetical protein